MALVAAATLATYTGSSDTVTIAQISSAVELWLQGWIPRYLGTSTTLTEVHDGPQRDHARITPRASSERLRSLWLQEEIAIGSLVSVKHRTTPDASFLDLSVDSAGDADLTDFEIRGPFAHSTSGRQLVRLGQTFPNGRGNLQIKYTHGYVEDAGPADVTYAVLALTKALLEAKTAGNLKSERVEGVAWTYSELASMPGVSVTMLTDLRRRSF